jgi:hypothetical protein
VSLVRTTAAAAIAASDTSITVTLATGFSAGYQIRIDQEEMRITSAYVSGTTIPVVRGQDGTQVVAHAILAGVCCGIASDWPTPTAQTSVQYPMAGRGRTMTTYGAAGALTLPTAGSDAVAILNSTVALAMTLANPTKDMDGAMFIVVGDGKAAHTVTYTAGMGNAGSGYTVMTCDVGAQCAIQMIAANSIWVWLPSPLSGTLSAADVAVA